MFCSILFSVSENMPSVSVMRKLKGHLEESIIFAVTGMDWHQYSLQEKTTQEKTRQALK